MAIYDTTNVLDNSIYLKSKLNKNMVGDNYYIENLQNKRNQDWYFRYNVVDIEEEAEKQISYSPYDPVFSSIETVISNVTSPTGEKLSDDWARVAFKDLQHSCHVGSRYRFQTNFGEYDLSTMTEEQKKNNLSIWIGVNKSSIKAGNSCMIRRCNSTLKFVGSPTKSYDYITEVHEEPCVVETEMRYIQIYYNQTLPIPQAEYYVTMQLNYFTNFIKINDRFLLGTFNTDDPQNNQAYQVKAVVKSERNKTYITSSQDELQSTDLILLGLDKVEVDPADNFSTRVAASTTMYKTSNEYVPPTEEEEPTHSYGVRMELPNEQRILLSTTQNYTVNLYDKNTAVTGTVFTFTCTLSGIVQKNWPQYFEFTKTGDNTFSIKNLKACTRGKLTVTYSCPNPVSGEEALSDSYEITLGGFY